MKIERNTIFADGENIILFVKDDKSKWEFAYTFEVPIITDITINIENNIDFESVNIFKGNKIFIPRPPPDVNFEINGQCRGDKYKVESSENGGLIPKLKIFDKVTISELFYVINKKLHKRQKR